MPFDVAVPDEVAVIEVSEVVPEVRKPRLSANPMQQQPRRNDLWQPQAMEVRFELK